MLGLRTQRSGCLGSLLRNEVLEYVTSTEMIRPLWSADLIH